MTMNEILSEYTTQIKTLKKELSITTQRYDSNAAELGKIARKLTEASSENLRLQKQVNNITEDHAKLALKHSTADVIIEKLTRDSNMYKDEMMKDKIKLNEQTRQIEMLIAKE